MSPTQRSRSIQGPSPDLTRREVEIITLIAKGGIPDRKIAQHLNLSVYTVRNHLRHIYRKLGVRSRVQAVIAWRKLTGDTPDKLPTADVTVTVHYEGLTWEGSVPLVPPPDC